MFQRLNEIDNINSLMTQTELSKVFFASINTFRKI